MSSKTKCKSCGSVGSIIEDASTGFFICTSCGGLQGISLTNESEFTELSNGNTSKNGQFIVSPSHKSQYQTNTTSSVEGKARIRTICESLPRLENQPDVCDLAERIFKRALHERFIRGRSVEIVSAACVYIAIRQKKTTGYLLVDVADHVDCGFFELAATALQLSKCMKETLPLIDPTLFIDRFTEELKFGHKSPEIKELAIQFIRRMDRDWIPTGRKPSGVCGAAIMLAAAKHGRDVPVDKIYKCARVCLTTINKRLKEIAKTEFAKLTFNDISQNPDVINDESNEIPPSMNIQEQLQSIAENITNKEKESTDDQSYSLKNDLIETFDEEDLKDVDDMILNEEEAETKAAIFYALYKTKLNKTIQLVNPTKNMKNENDYSKDDSLNFNFNTDENDKDEDEIVSNAENFDDF